MDSWYMSVRQAETSEFVGAGQLIGGDDARAFFEEGAMEEEVGGGVEAGGGWKIGEGLEAGGRMSRVGGVGGVKEGGLSEGEQVDVQVDVRDKGMGSRGVLEGRKGAG
jgi:hypothetical protein